jgi:hypothetical protein
MTPVESSSLRNRAESRLLQRIVASPAFVRSPRLSAFLVYICERFFEGRLDEISEQHIGIHVFERPADYHPAEDSIVRSHARLLRRKLEAYFETEGKNERLVLTIPRGSYLPVFEAKEVAGVDLAVVEPVTPEPSGMPVVPEAAAARRLSVRTATICLALCAACAATGYWLGRPETRPAPRTHPLWSRMFEGPRAAVFVPADTGLVIFQNLTRRNLGLLEYSTHDFGAGLPGTLDTAGKIALDLGARRYTSIVDLNLATRLIQLPWAIPGHLQIRYARDIKLDDLKGVGVILSGVAEANPWVHLFEGKLNFQFAIDEGSRTFRVSNRRPAPGESESYFNSPSDPLRRAYGLIAYQPGLTGKESVLLVEGTTMAGTEAAADFVLNDDALLPALRKIMQPHEELPHFEILVATTNMGGQAPQSQLIAVRKDP